MKPKLGTKPGTNSLCFQMFECSGSLVMTAQPKGLPRLHALDRVMTKAFTFPLHHLWCLPDGQPGDLRLALVEVALSCVTGKGRGDRQRLSLELFPLSTLGWAKAGTVLLVCRYF